MREKSQMASAQRIVDRACHAQDVLRPGRDVLVIRAESPHFNSLGETAGPGDTAAGLRVRVVIEDEIYLFRLEDLEVI